MPGALRHHPMPVSISCDGAVFHPERALSRPLAGPAHIEAAHHRGEMAISDVDGGENLMPDQKMTTRIL
jgi:hypothetical protein